MVTQKHLYLLYLCIPVMRRAGYRVTHIEEEVIKGIHSDLRFTKPKHKPVIIELQSTGKEKINHKIKGSYNLTIDLRAYHMDCRLDKIIAILRADIFAQIESFELAEKKAKKEEWQEKQRVWKLNHKKEE